MDDNVHSIGMYERLLEKDYDRRTRLSDSEKLNLRLLVKEELLKRNVLFFPRRL